MSLYDECMTGNEAVHFQPKHHYLIRQTLGAQAGGAMQAMLRRSRAIHDFIGVPIDFLTFGFQAGEARAEETLRSRGQLTPQISVTNMWDMLAAVADGCSPLGRSAYPERGVIPPSLPEGSTAFETDTGLRRITPPRESSRQSPVVYTRPDGSSFVNDMGGEPNSSTARRVSLLDRSGEALQSWISKTDMFAWLLTHVLGAERSLIIVDNPMISKAIAANNYLTPNSVLVKYYHSSHVEARKRVSFGILRSKHKTALDKADIFDVSAFPTNAQRNAAAMIVGEAPCLITLGNVVEPPADTSHEEVRSHTSAVVMSRLVASKNIDHAIRAIAESNSRAEGGQCPTNLAIFGRGSTRSELEELIGRTGSERQIHLMGYSTDVYSEFQKASFSLLPTGQEAFGLSLVESMACGCIPISYDVLYGPGDIITDGVDGFLVPFGDVEGLADRVSLLRTMDASQLTAMRDAARRRARDFSAENIGEYWSKAVSAAWNRKLRLADCNLSNPRLSVACVSLTGPRLRAVLRRRRDAQCLLVELTGEDLEHISQASGLRAFISLRGRTSNLRIRIPGSFESKRAKRRGQKSKLALYFDLLPEILAQISPETIDIYVRVNDGNTAREFRVPAKGILPSRIRLPPGLEAYATVKNNLSFRRSSKRS